MIIWLASYPKSGNTWVRSFLSAYYYSLDGKFDFKLLKKIKQFPSDEFFEKKLRNVEEASANWLTAQKKLIQKENFTFLKTHNIFGAFKGNSFTSSELTLGAIYIVRDPRNIISSLMNHYSLNEEGALKMINSIYRNLRNERDSENYSSYSFISSWNNNYNSWKSLKNIKTLIVKYEDLEMNTENTFLRIIKFTNDLINKNQSIKHEKFNSAIASTNFEVLKKKEESEGFDEAVYSSKEMKNKAFFNLGNKNNYKKLLKTETIEVVENLFNKEMEELGYL